jgi:sec-independent protein translocase protein TatA
MPGFIGVPELILLGLVLLLVFGPKRLPEMGRSLGRGMREFKDSVSNMTDSSEDEPKHEETKEEGPKVLTAEPVAVAPVGQREAA